MEMRKFADYILEAFFFSFKIVGQDLFTCGLLIKSNWTLAILLFLFLGLPVFCTLARVVAEGLHSRLFFLPDACTPGWPNFFWHVGCTVIYRLRLWPAAVPARLLFSLADTSCCFQPQTLCLPFWTCYAPDPTFPFGAKRSIWHKTFMSVLGSAPISVSSSPWKWESKQEQLAVAYLSKKGGTEGSTSAAAWSTNLGQMLRIVLKRFALQHCSLQVSTEIILEICNTLRGLAEDFLDKCVFMDHSQSWVLSPE